MKRYKTIYFILLMLSIVVFSIAGNFNKVNATEVFDSYGNISWQEEQAHLGNFAIFLNRNPDTVGYIGFYIGKNAKSKSVKARILRAKNFLMSEFKIKNSRIIIVNLGKREENLTILQPAEKDKSPF